MKLMITAVMAGCAAVLGSAQIASASTHVNAPSVLRATFDDLQGTIKTVDVNGMSFVLTAAGNDTTIRFDERTAFVLDGKASTASEALRVGATTQVSHKDRLASRVDVKSKVDTAALAAELDGSIKSVDEKGMSFVVTSSGGDVTVRVNADTVFTLDGKDSTMRDALRVGASAHIVHRDNLASRVEVRGKG